MSKKTAKMAIDRLQGEYIKFAKNSDIRANENEVYYHNLLFAKVYEGYTTNRLFVSLQNFRTEPKLRQAKKDLVKAAINAGYEIIFVPEIDMGFGVSNAHDCSRGTLEVFLIEIAKYCDENIKNAALVYMENEDETRKILGAAINQKDPYEYDDTIIHAEEVLCNYVIDLELYGHEKLRYYSLIEPCERCLKQMLNNQACGIYYFVKHDTILDTPEYYQLCNDIWNKSILQSYHETPIRYDRVYGIKADKFMNKEKSK